ncbi:MAG TPA: oxidative damage protection protein, partial [Polyangiaceae bacterium]|nr:oxidative damage protection protein [Polyangiaceae bacterium]
NAPRLWEEHGAAGSPWKSLDGPHPGLPPGPDFRGSELTLVPLARIFRGPMPRTVHCVKLDCEAEGLEKPPFKGPLGERIFQNVSSRAWRIWLDHSKMLINEFRLDLTSETGQRIWMTECEKYFFGEGSELPPDFVPDRR